MKLPRLPGWILALAWIVPATLAAQSHGLEPEQRVRIQYAGLAGSHMVEGKVGRATEDSVAVKPRAASARTIAWANVEWVSVWKADPPRKDALGVLGGLGGAILGGFATVGRSESSGGGQVTEATVVRGAVVGGIIGAAVGVGLSYVIRTRSWHVVTVHPGLIRENSTMALSFSVPVGRP